MSSSPRCEPALAQNGGKNRLDLVAQLGVGVANPGDLAENVDRRAQSLARGVGDEHPRFARDELRREVVGMAANAERAALPAQERFDERAKVGDPPVVAGDELVELAAGGDVLIF